MHRRLHEVQQKKVNNASLVQKKLSFLLSSLPSSNRLCITFNSYFLQLLKEPMNILTCEHLMVVWITSASCTSRIPFCSGTEKVLVYPHKGSLFYCLFAFWECPLILGNVVLRRRRNSRQPQERCGRFAYTEYHVFVFYNIHFLKRLADSIICLKEFTT